MPNPLYPVSTAPFQLVLISGQISTCFGCRKGFMKPAVRALNLVEKHEDNRSYTTHNGSPRQRYGNVYYHLDRSCITTKQPHINPNRLVVSQEVVEGARHTDYLKPCSEYYRLFQLLPITSRIAWCLSLFLLYHAIICFSRHFKHFHASKLVSACLHFPRHHYTCLAHSTCMGVHTKIQPKSNPIII